MKNLKLTKLIDKQPHEKPKRVIYGGVLYHDNSFTPRKQLFGNSPNSFIRNHANTRNVWNGEKMDAALRDKDKRAKGRLRVSTNETSLIRGTILDSIKDVGIYPVEIVVETPQGSVERYLVTE